MADVFISYKRRLRPRVEEIAAALRALGLDVWFDASLEAGSSFSAEISNEVRTAKCVLVCWSDDAFPHGGDRNGWVVGEATIGQGRNCLVPVLLETADLDPPWNTLQTEDLTNWAPDAADQSGWRATLSAIGRLVGRPDLAAEDEALRGGQPVVPRNREVPSAQAVLIAALAGAVITALGAVLLAGIDPTIRGGLAELLAGVALAVVPLAWLYWRTGRLMPLKAAGLVVIFVVVALVASVVGLAAVGPLRGNPAQYDLAEIIDCAVAGLVGGGLSLAAFPLLGLATRNWRTALRIGVSAVVLAGVAAFVAAMPFFQIETYNSAEIWLAAVWQLAYAPLLVWVIRRSG